MTRLDGPDKTRHPVSLKRLDNDSMSLKKLGKTRQDTSLDAEHKTTQD